MKRTNLKNRILYIILAFALLFGNFALAKPHLAQAKTYNATGEWENKIENGSIWKLSLKLSKSSSGSNNRVGKCAIDFTANLGPRYSLLATAYGSIYKISANKYKCRFKSYYTNETASCIITLTSNKKLKMTNPKNMSCIYKNAEPIGTYKLTNRNVQYVGN